jgi:uncharacterized membrane protein
MKETALKHFIETTVKGLFWLLPIAAVILVVLWLYEKIDSIVAGLFSVVGFAPEDNQFLWLCLVIILFVVLVYLVGHIMETRLASFFESLISKIPGYSTIKDIINIFNSSKKGETKVLVVAIRGFANQGYNIGLMYSQKQSIIKDHYTVTLSQTPIPNGGYMFEVHKKEIFVIEEASFDHNLQYLLSMGVKSIADIIGTEPKTIDELNSLEKWLEKKGS